jgi:hypothetical protein
LAESATALVASAVDFTKSRRETGNVFMAAMAQTMRWGPEGNPAV